MRLSCVALQRWSFMTDVCESIHYLGFITVIELSLPWVRPNYWALNPARFLIKTSPNLLSACLTAKMSSPLQTCTLHLCLPLSLASVLLLSLSNALPLSVLALELLEKCAPLKRRSLIWVQKKSSKSPRLTRFPPSPKTLRYLSEHIHQEWSE